MSLWLDFSQFFLLAFSALFSIINPLSGALIFGQLTAGRSHGERVVLAKRIAVYSAALILGSLWFGVYVLNFFGITVAALRIGGGIVVAAAAWQMLYAPEAREERKESQAGEAMDAQDPAFFPLTMPMTTGPGTISVAIALSSNRPGLGGQFPVFLAATSAAALAVALTIWISYRFADRITDLLGRARAQIVSRLAAFMLLCVGVQITLNGVMETLRSAGIGSAPS
ncbi:MarC family protein [Aureimonas psammosilenae]|uniref:MarC family protein n=1 Tax=Aureimonas psammosilenae TaxID=2495496 RepID=UPI0012604296|nr:MarC family protein [Aureimonas psammosilenae]